MIGQHDLRRGAELHGDGLALQIVEARDGLVRFDRQNKADMDERLGEDQLLTHEPDIVRQADKGIAFMGEQGGANDEFAEIAL